MSILVFGSFAVDLTSRSKGLPVPGQTLIGSSFKMGPGGKGSNQAVAAHRAGADVTMVTKIGKDVFGKVALDFYQGEGMNTEYILQDEEIGTGTAVIMVDELSAQNEIVVTPGACGRITPEDVEKCRPLIEQANLLLLQLEINFDALFQVIDIASKADVKIILNPAPAAKLPDEIMAKIDIITPNETEAKALTGITVKDAASAEQAARVLTAKGVKQVVITMGSLGSFAFDGEKGEMIPRLTVNAVDTTGAGDAFNGGFAKALDDGKDLFTALRYGNVTGALSVTKVGAAPSMPYQEEIEAMFSKYDQV